MSKELTVSNLYGIRGTITHRTDSNVLVITGESGNGKSSFVNSFGHVFAHKAIKGAPDPIRNGEDEGYATFTDDDGTQYTRRFKGGKMLTLEIRTADGGKFSQPADYLASKFGTITVDVSAFLTVDEKVRREMILAKSTFPEGFSLDAANRAQADAETRRTEANREAKRTEGVLSGFARPIEGTPAEEVSAQDVLTQLDSARQNNQNVNNATDRGTVLLDLIAELEAKLTAAKTESEQVRTYLATNSLVDTTDLEGQLASLEETNRAVRERQAYERAKTDHENAATAATNAVQALEATKAAKTDALANADLPHPSLSFNDEFVLVDGVAWPSANSGMRSLVALATAIAGEHSEDALKLVILKEGDWLDAKCLAAASEMLAAKGFFGLVDRGRPDIPQGVGIDVIEMVDGEVA